VYPAKISLKYKGEIKIFFFRQNLREFVTKRHLMKYTKGSSLGLKQVKPGGHVIHRGKGTTS
jgi:hypothetical protein